MGKGPKSAKQSRLSSGSVSDQLVREIAARVEQYGQVLAPLSMCK